MSLASPAGGGRCRRSVNGDGYQHPHWVLRPDEEETLKPVGPPSLLGCPIRSLTVVAETQPDLTSSVSSRPPAAAGKVWPEGCIYWGYPRAETFRVSKMNAASLPT